MATLCRAGTSLLLASGLALALLMVSLVAPFGPGLGRLLAPGSRSAEAADVAVFFPDYDDWHNFRDGIEVCARRGLIRDVDGAVDDVVTLKTRGGRAVRFTWHDAQGLLEAQDEVRRLAERPTPPIAVVGSNNTILTAGLARALAEARSRTSRDPVLLIPQATSVLADLAGGGAGAIPLLEIDRGRTFRFCLDNQRQADLAIACLVAHDPSPAGRAVILVDDNDPYSVDLAACFRRSIARFAPGATIEMVHPDALNSPAHGGLTSLSDTPGLVERRWAAQVWRTARDLDRSGKGTTWLVLPLQDQPAQRMLIALRGQDRDNVPLRVVCGDGIGLATLAHDAGLLTFPVWCPSSASTPDPDLSPTAQVADDIQIPAEIVAAIVRCLDTPGATDFRETLASLHLQADDPSALGRSLAFLPTGERRGDDLGRVLAIQPGRTAVLSYWRAPADRWRNVIVADPSAPVARR